jgi:hypothetical protein
MYAACYTEQRNLAWLAAFIKIQSDWNPVNFVEGARDLKSF